MFVASDAAQNNLSHLPIISLSLVISYLMNNLILCSWEFVMDMTKNN